MREDPVVFVWIWIHGWTSRLAFNFLLILAIRLGYLYHKHRSLGHWDRLLVVVSQVLLSFTIIFGFYLSGPLNAEARIAHHVLGTAPLFTTVIYVAMVSFRRHSLSYRRMQGLSLILVITNVSLTFLAYWMSWAASLGWWPWPEMFPWEYRVEG